MSTSASSSSQTLAEAVVQALVGNGVRDVVLAPGSRSAPLAYALLAAESQGVLRLHVVIDERSAGFVALGLAAQTDLPVAVAVTSGSAVANLHPAVLEAGHQRVPLVVISCDRPAELVRRATSQTTRHAGLFGEGTDASRPRAAASIAEDFEAPTEVARLIRASLGAGRRTDPAGLRAPGAVHLNVEFADPLVPDPNSPVDVFQSGPLPQFWSSSIPNVVDAGPRTVLLVADGAGPIGDDLAQSGRWPVLAEPSSGVHGPGILTAVPALVEALGSEIERVIVVGRPTLSRQVTQLLARDDVEVLILDPRGAAWFDAPGASHAEGSSWVATLEGEKAEPDDHEWNDAWRAAGQAVQRELDLTCVAGPLTGDGVARMVSQAVHHDSGLLFAGASMAIRYLDLAGVPGAAVVASRGLAGIDGSVSTAVGYALGRSLESGTESSGAMRALIGDLTLQHDAGGLIRGRLEREVDLQIVVLNDGGGSIFATLEHGRSEHAEAHERIFATPQTLDIAALAAAAGVSYVRVEDATGLRLVLAAPVRGISILEVALERSGAADRRRELHARLVQAAREAVGG